MRRDQESRNDRYQAARQCLLHRDQGLKTMWSEQLFLRSVSETQWHEHRNSEVKRFLKLITSWQRKPRNERRRRSRNRLIGPTPLEREEHCRTHEPYRAWCHACIAGRGRADLHAMRNGSESTTGTCGAHQRRTLVTLWKQNTMTVIRLTGSGRALQAPKVEHYYADTQNHVVMIPVMSWPEIFFFKKKLSAPVR